MTTISEVSQQHPQAAHCDALYEVRDDAVGLRAFIALHDLTHGPGYGGIRRRVFKSVREAVAEVVGLAEQMTLKTAFAGLPAGGAKAVILDTPQLAEAASREALYEAFGRAVESLGGAYFAGPDVGTAEDELAALRHTSRYVSTEDAHPSQSTAIGVLAACREALSFLGLEVGGSEGDHDIVVAGVGTVGSRVAAGLAAMGGRLGVADLDEARAHACAEALGARLVAPADALRAEALLLVPCGVAPIVTAATLAGFRTRVICGAANHQLEVDTLAHELAERGVLYVPDFAVNSGAVIEGVLRHTTPAGEDVAERVRTALLGIGPRIRAILEEAARLDITPLEAALSRIDLVR